MNTPTAISEIADAGGSWPVGFPNVGTLERLAHEMIAGLRQAIAPEILSSGLESAAAASAGGWSSDWSGTAVPDSEKLAVPGAVAGLELADLATAPFASAGNWLRPETFGLPGEAELQHLLSGAFSRPATKADTSPAPDSGFYFLDARATDLPHTAPAAIRPAREVFNVATIRRDFPILAERLHGRPLIWLDNAATTQKPQAVIDRLANFYAHENSNIHRAAHTLAARATEAYEHARSTVARFLGASSPEEIVFVRGTTEAINLVAQSWGRQHIGEGDEIIVSHLEHHANIVPWQQLAIEQGAKLRVIPVDDHGQILLDAYQRLLTPRTRLVSISQVSNALGTVTPVREVIELAHAAGARVLVDAAQSVSHLPVDVQALDADFLAFSGHKVFGPTGIGVLYGKADVLESMPPWQGGGNMITDVTFERTLYQHPPSRFEAGTGNIADAVGLGAALEYMELIGRERIAHYEHELLLYATEALQQVPGLRLIGTAPDKTSVLSFVLEGHRPEEIGEALNREGIAVRAGHHCAQPILRRFGLEATVRPSLAFYNTHEEIDTLVQAVRRLAHRTVSNSGR
ncbi:MAG: cysteine desulfurase [Chromatiales bacterium]|nr:cysteine desulfurase [Chromatiales bacterium]